MISGAIKKRIPGKDAGKKKVEKVMHEYKEGLLHSGTKKGPVVSSRKQAVAIAISEAKKKGKKITRKRGELCLQ